MEATGKPIETKREEFRKYLEKTGVLEALTKVLVNLYEQTEKPVDALDNLIAAENSLEKADSNVETDELKKKIEALELENTELRSRLEKYEPMDKFTDNSSNKDILEPN